ncbi:MAG: hypothetical protein ABSG32_27230 [Terriglobia bacterium]
MSVNGVGERPPLSGFAGLVGGAILTFLFLIVAIAEFGWVLGMPIRGFVLPTAFVGSCLVTAWGARTCFRRPLRITLVVAALLALLVATSAGISRAFYDVSFDGQAYHQEGVYQLARGWNPLFTPDISPISIDQNVKLIHFTKGPWIIAAAMYRLTGHIETGKFASILLVCAAFSLALAVFAGLRKKLSAWPVAMAVLVAANPVTLCQIFTFYVDGQMASLLACVAALCYLSAAEGNPWVNLLLFEAAVLVIQVKFTGLVYVTIFLAGFLALLAWQKRPLRKPLYVALLALGLGTFVFGKNPYVLNFFENGNPFYPFFGRGDFPIITMTTTTPPEFLQANRARNLAASIFSKSSTWPPQSTLKAPWHVDRDEWTAFEQPDVLTGGFGPLFPAALVLSLLLLAIGLWKGGAAPWTAAAVILIMIGSVLPVSACWWARYGPQVWLVPLVALAPFGGAVERPLLRRFSWLALLILSANAAGIAEVNFRANLIATRETAESLDDLRSHAPFKVAFGNFRSHRFRLREAGIPFIEDEGTLKCDPEVKENDDLCIEH